MLAITTCRAYPEPPPNLLPLADRLNAQGISTRFDIWQNHPDTPYLLPLCVWDYAAAPQQFAGWLATAETCRQRFINPPELMRWNMDKRYLCDLAAWGADVVPCVYGPSESESVWETVRQNGWREAVVKPAVGQSGRFVCKISADGKLPDLSVYPQGLIIQPYIREIEQCGETSIIFFGGRFSHAVHRCPPQGEWRANSAYGVTVSPVSVPESALSTAQGIFAKLPQIPAYARIDGILAGNRFLLNELELIEPALYLHTAEGATERLAAVLAGILSEG
ncbi:ATP-grasp domain-containing protein [Neisseria chenwenguii]|uniref:Glutathione synthetase n=1 Tax=Neisseria chenwenguii TaxID=1853278 RepID=A0A220S4P4_9NEIS|nr:glutathione synthetase [Neisseria chenwenguii]ASK28420.1 glutathione synthetase [Neisseria chenwenguii]ROV56793.1 glutathione synthetase [Neisseria chenwenguii]